MTGTTLDKAASRNGLRIGYAAAIAMGWLIVGHVAASSSLFVVIAGG
jgi:hypothetical protein